MYRSALRIIVVTAALTVILLPAAACQPPPATPTRADSTAGLSVCWRPDDAGDDEAGLVLRRALRARLETAGYKTVAGGRCDIQMQWTYTAATKGGDVSFTSTTLVVRGKGDQLIEKYRVEFMRGDAPIQEPDRVAVRLVNEMNASAKLAAYAANRRSLPAGDAGAPSIKDAATADGSPTSL